MPGLYLPRLEVINTAGGTAQDALSSFAIAEAQAFGATSVYDAKDILTADQQQLKNRAYPTAARAKRGSTARAQIVPGGLYLPGEDTNYASTPFKASFNGGTSSFELYVQTGSLSVTRSTSQMVASRWVAAGNQRAFYLQLQTTGVPQIAMSTDGATVAFVVASSTAITAGATGVGVTRNPTTGSVSFYQELSGSWVLLSTVSSVTGALFASTAALEVGSYALGAGGLNFQGLIRSATFTVGGTIVASPDFVAAIDGNTTLVDAQSNVWTVTATTGVDTNDPVFLPHTGEHYLRFSGVADNRTNTALTGSTLVGANAFSAYVRFDYTSGHLVSSTSAERWRVLAIAGKFALELSDLATGNYVALVFSASELASTYHHMLLDHDASAGTVRMRLSSQAASTPRGSVVWEFDDTLTHVGGYRTIGSGLFDVGSNGPSAGVCSVYEASLEIASVPIKSFNPGRDINTAGNPNAGQTSWVSATGETWATTRSATGLKTAVVTRPVPSLDGTDDLIQLPASDTPTFTKTTGKHTVVVAFRAFERNAFRRLWSAQSALGDKGAALDISNAGALRGVVGFDASNRVFPTVASGRIDDGQLRVAALIVEDGLARVYLAGTGLGANADFSAISNNPVFAAPRLGCDAFASSNVLDGEIFACRTYKDQALTAPELDAIAARLLEGAYA